MIEGKIAGLSKIDEWVREELRKPGNNHVCGIFELDFNDRFVKLLPFSHASSLIYGELFSDLSSNESFEDDFPLAIDIVVLRAVVNSFVRQQSADQAFPEITDHYRSMAERCRSCSYLDREEEIYPSPNALAILLYGVLEFGSGLNEKQEGQFNAAVRKAIMVAGKNYAWQTYYRNYKRPEHPARVVIDGVEIMTPAKTPKQDNIKGITKIELAIARRLSETGNKQFIPLTCLTALEPDASQAREIWGSEQPLVPLGSDKPKQWEIGRQTLEALADRFAEQLQNDRRVNENLFADQIYSPAAQALLLHGIKYATRDILGEQDEGLMADIIRRFALETSVANEAKKYAQCINLGLTPAELECEGSTSSRPLKQPAVTNRRIRGTNL